MHDFWPFFVIFWCIFVVFLVNQGDTDCPHVCIAHVSCFQSLLRSLYYLCRWYSTNAVNGRRGSATPDKRLAGVRVQFRGNDTGQIINGVSLKDDLVFKRNWSVSFVYWLDL